MSKSELKDLLIKRIRKMDDAAFLNALKIFTDAKLESDRHRLTPLERKKIITARKQYRKGEVISNEDIFNEAKE